MTKKGAFSKIKENIPCIILLAFTFFIFGPLQLYLTNVGEFWFTLEHIFPFLIVSFLVVLLILTGISLLIPEKLSKYFIAVVFGIGFALYIQGNFINLDYGVLDGTPIDWSQYKIPGIFNTLFWIFCLLAPPFLVHAWPGQIIESIKSISLVIICIQIITIGTLLVTTKLPENSNISVTEKGMFSLSKDKNLIIFILDSFDASYMNEILNQRPEYKEYFQDFTYYNNTLGAYPTTKGAVPYILTGERYDNSVPYQAYIENAYKSSELYNVLPKEGYDIGLYTSRDFLPASNSFGIINTVIRQEKPSSILGLGMMMYKSTAFSYFPHVIKSLVWYYSGEFNNYVDTNVSGDSSEKAYLLNDIKYYEKLTNDGLEFSNPKYAFRVYHLEGPHAPYTMTENIEIDENGTSEIEESIGSLNIVLSYINQLKEEGVYDNTCIIVLADHGKIGFCQNPLLMVKPREKRGDLLLESSAPVSYEDLCSTIMYLCTDNDKYKSNIFTWTENDVRTRKYYYYTWDNSWNKDFLPDIYEYITSGHAADVTGMVKTGLVYTSNGIKKSYGVRASLGEELKFGGNSKVQGAFEYGFSGDEGSHIWNLGYESKLTLGIDDKDIKNEDLALVFKFKYMLGDSQRIRCYINDVFVEEKTIKSVTKPVSFLFSSELVADKKLSIVLEFPDAQPIGKPQDNRTVALAFEQMTIDYAINVLGYVKVGDKKEIIDFSGTGNSDIIINEGWYAQEPTHRWASEEADIVFYTEKIQDYLLTVEYLTFIHSGDTQVFFNGEEVAVWKKNASLHTESIVLPAELCNSNGIQTVTFITNNAKSPKKTGEGNDSRVLGIDVKSMTIEPYQLK